MSRRQGLARRLTNAGFRRLYPNDKDPIQYRREVGVCFVDVQLWKDGSHRVASGVDDHEDKEPTSFRDVADMWEAIRTEEIAAGMKMNGDRNKQYRAGLVVSAVKERRGLTKSTDIAWAADVAIAQLRDNPDRPWTAIVDAVMQIMDHGP